MSRRKGCLYLAILVLSVILLIIVYPREKHIKYISYGDSITYADGNPYSDGSLCVGYQVEVIKMMGISEFTNVSVPGQTMAAKNDSTGGLVEMICRTDNKYAEVCTILIGTNDFYNSKELGIIQSNVPEYDLTTFVGAYQTSIEYLMEDNPDMLIVLVTPPQASDGEIDISTANESGYTLLDYVNAVKTLGEYYDCPVCDLYSDSGITVDNINEYTADGVHPNNVGFELIGKMLAEIVSENMK